jgi:hypothetical protein
LLRHTHITFDIQFHRSVISRPENKWTIAILFTIEIILQSKNFIGLILIHRRFGSRAVYNIGVRGIPI